MASDTLKVKGWSTFQHYKHRRPPWIKLHRSLLDDAAYWRLPVASRALAPCIWLLASESDDGTVTASADDLAFRFRMDVEALAEAVNPLIELGFLVGCLQVASNVLATRKQVATTESEKSRDRERQQHVDSGDSAEAVAKRYLAVFDAVYQRRTRKLSDDLVKKTRDRLKAFEAWQVVATPILVRAQKPDRTGYSPEVFLRDGEHARTRNGETMGAYYWMARTWESADGTKLSRVLTGIAKGAGVLEELLAFGVVPATDEQVAS